MSQGRYAVEFIGAVQERPAAQAATDVARLADGLRGGLGIPVASEVPGVVEQAMGQVVRGAVLAETGYGGLEAGPGQAGAGQFALGPQHRGQVPGLVGVEHGKQLAGGGGVVPNWPVCPLLEQVWVPVAVIGVLSR